MLTLKRLEVSNFKKHEKITLDLSEGLNIVVGPNYAGKSTLLQAILFAIYGVTAVPGGSKSIQRRGTSAQPKVTLTASYKGSEIELSRTPLSASGFMGGELKASGNTAVASWVEDLIGIPKQLAMSLAYSEQSDTAALLTLGYSKLDETVQQVSKASVIEDIRKRVTASCEPLQLSQDRYARAVENKELLVSQIEEGMLKLPKLKEEEAVLAEECKELGLKLTSAKEEERTCLESLAAVTTGLQVKERLEVKLLKTSEAISEKKEQLSRLPEGAKETLQEITEKQATIQASTSLAESKQREAKAAVKEADAELHKALQQKADFISAREALNTHKDSAERVAGKKSYLDSFIDNVGKGTGAVIALELKLERNATEINDRVESLRNGVCSKCNRPMEGVHLDSIKEELSGLQLTRKKIERELSEVKDTLANYENLTLKAKEEISKLERNLLNERELLKMEALQDVQDEEIEALRLSLEEANATLAKRNGELSELLMLSYEKEIARLKTIVRNASDLEASLKEFEVQLKDTASQIADITFTEADKERTSARLREAKDYVAFCEGSLSSRTSLHVLKIRDLEDQERVIKASEVKLENLNRDLEKLASEVSRLERLKKFNKWLSDSKAEVLQNIWDSILSVSTDFTEQATDGRVGGMGRTGEFTFTEQGSDEPLPVSGCASGGQKAIMGTGLKLALSKYVPQGLGFILLDEPTSELNQEHAAMFTGAIKATGVQVVMVSHREADELEADNVVCL